MSEIRGQVRFWIAGCLGLGILFSPPVLARQGKSVWNWSLEERLAARFDPGKIAARAEKRAARDKAARELFPSEEGLEDSSSSNALRDEIRGRETPELFLPIELFNALMESGFLAGEEYQTEYRDRIQQRAVALGFGKDLWSRLERVTGSYLTLQRRRERLSTQKEPLSAKDTAELEAVSNRSCLARAQALAAAKKEFGEEAFLRLLYEAIATSVSISYEANAQAAENLRRMEGGCQ
jgi:hypothetical protein